MVNLDGHIFESGDEIICEIRGTTVEGAIYIVPEISRAWICHSNPELDGNLSPDRMGYEYSWVFLIDDYRTHGEASEMTNIRPRKNNGLKYKPRYVDEDLLSILREVLTKDEMSFCFYKSLGPFQNFDKVSLTKCSNNLLVPGMITLRGTFEVPSNSSLLSKGIVTKKVEIKLSRYIKRLSDAYVEYLINQGLEAKTIFNDQRIEKIQNKFIAASTGDAFALELLSGSDIDKGYLKANYAKLSGSIAKSCMNGKIDFLSIYRQNSCCQLAILKSEAGIEARCFIWDVDGKKYFDRIYYTSEWINNLMTKKLIQLGYENLREQKLVMIKLDNHIFTKYPYIDSFRYQKAGTNEFYFCESTDYLPKSTEYICYCSTDGGWEKRNFMTG